MQSEAPPVAKSGRTFRDIALTLAVLLVPVFLVVVGYRLLGHETPPAVDATPAYDAARVGHAFPVLTPTNLPDGWRISVAQYRERVLRVGLVGPNGSGVQLVETASPVDAVVPAEVGGHPDGEVSVHGTAWQRYTGGRDGERALVLATPGRTVLVAGSVPDRDLVAVAGSLR
jgi:Protein of unknown function (DUF4245)